MARFAPTVELRPEASCLVLVDLQYGLAARAPGLEQLVVPGAQRLLAGFRELGLRRAFLVTGTTAPDWSDVPPHVRALCRTANLRPGEREHEVLDELAPRPGEPVIAKTTMSAFASTGFEALVRSWGVTTLIFAGLTTNAGVEHNVRDAADRGFACAVVGDACAAATPAMHDAALLTLGRHYGAVTTADEVLERIGAGVTAGAGSAPAP